MPRTFIVCAGLAALILSTPPAFAKPDEQQQGNNNPAADGQHQQGKSKYPYDPHARGPYYGALVPPPPETFNQDYPICTKEITDGCVNPNQLKRMNQGQTEGDGKAENAEPAGGE